MTIAGHSFTGLNGRCSCGKQLGDITWTTEADLEKPDIAHQGNYKAYELAEVRAEVARIWELTVNAATGAGPSRTVEDEIAAMEAA